MIDRTHDLSIVRQAKVLNISRGSVYYKPRPVSAEDLVLMRRIDELHLEYPFAGGRMTVVTTIPKEKAKAFAHRLSKALSGDHDLAKVDMVDRLNRQLRGWAAFYKYTDFTATTFQHIDHVVFWKMAHWVARKYRSRIKPLMRNWYRVPADGQAKTWLVYGVSERGRRVGKALHRLVSSPKAQFRWRNPEANPYIFREEPRKTITSRYRDVAMAMGQT